MQRRGFSEFRWRPIAVACLLVAVSALTSAAQDVQRGTPSRPARPASPEAKRAVLAAYRSALSQPAVRRASGVTLMRQVARNKPIAFVNGYWVIPLNLTPAFKEPTVREAMLGGLAQSAGGKTLFESLVQGSDLIPRQPDLVLGFALIPNQIIGELRETTADIDRLVNLGDSLLQEKATDNKAKPPTSRIGWIILGVELAFEVGVAIFDYFTEADEKSPDDPESDPDGDGIINRLDGDDDGDSVQDDQDDYPYDPDASICDCPGGINVGSFAPELSQAITNIVIQGFQLQQRADVPTQTLSLVPSTDQRIGLQVVTSALPR